MALPSRYGPQQVASEGPPQGQAAGAVDFLDMDRVDWLVVQSRIIRQIRPLRRAGTEAGCRNIAVRATPDVQVSAIAITLAG